ncbi:hypothetical protein [Pedobacter sp. KBW06]|uniref:hypothetical protein n=1 Tax=Pedobacter sp. KBW06 TaxID=2153359 RepID=UPI000F59E90C|nr:hypothetical protein [Pedobacter sp. KBW06]
MKKLVLVGVLLGVVFFNHLNAQVKKTAAKPKGKPEVTKEPVLNKIDFFSQTPDGVVQIFNDELKKLQIVLRDIQETTTYDYDAKGKKLRSIASTSKRLIFDKALNASVVADKNDYITEISLELNNGNGRHFKAIKKMLGLIAWPVIAQNETDTTFRNGNLVATTFSYKTLNEDGDETGKNGLALSIKRISPYAYVPKELRLFDPQDIIVHDNAEDVGYAVVEFMKKIGLNLLYQDYELSFAMEGELSGYSRNYQFSNSLLVTITTSALRKMNRIELTCKDPITFSKLKKALGIQQWTKTGSNPELGADFYESKNIHCNVYSSAKFIWLEIKPLEDDMTSRLENTKTPGFDNLAALYQSGSPEQVIKTITGNYVNGIKYDNGLKKWVSDPLADKLKFYFKTPNAPVAVCIFNYKVSLNDNNSLAMYLYSRDIQYLKDILSQYQNSPSRSKYVYMIKKDNNIVEQPSDFDEIWFMDRAVRAQQLAGQEQQQAETARRKEQERLEAIEQEKQKAARSMETLNKLGDFLKTPRKKP